MTTNENSDRPGREAGVLGWIEQGRSVGFPEAVKDDIGLALERRTIRPKTPSRQELER